MPKYHVHVEEIFFYEYEIEADTEVDAREEAVGEWQTEGRTDADEIKVYSRPQLSTTVVDDTEE